MTLRIPQAESLGAATMRAIIPVVCLFLGGCSSRVIQQEVADSSGSNRLARVDRMSGSDADFDALVWRTKTNATWRERVVISQAAFQAGSPRRGWVSELHSLDASSGTAIIKVAEGDAPEGAPMVRYIYSWREWNLLTNGEVRFIRTCANPFEKYRSDLK